MKDLIIYAVRDEDAEKLVSLAQTRERNIGTSAGTP